MLFTRANLATGKNTATIDFMQKFDEEGEYELIVMGRDVVGNKAGDLEYHINFNVITKAMISNLLNYPNPFTTSTAFVFTITGNEVPQNMRIQILTITGKIVREITKDELGPIHVGRNKVGWYRYLRAKIRQWCLFIQSINQLKWQIVRKVQSRWR